MTTHNTTMADFEPVLPTSQEAQPLLHSEEEIQLGIDITIMSNVFLTAFQPLYGRFSDIFGQRTSFFTITVTFMAGCLGCGVAKNVVFLDLMRALTGIGGGDLMAMATVISSDLIPFRRRRGSIVDSIGWRWCLLMQAPLALLALLTRHLVLNLPVQSRYLEDGQGLRAIWRLVDISVAFALTLGLSTQLVGLSLGGNELPWFNVWVVMSLLASVAFFAMFVLIEGRTRAVPLIPLRMLKGVLPVTTQVANVCVGMAAYTLSTLISGQFLFTLSFRRTARIPFFAAPIGGIISGFVISRWGKLAYLVRAGSLLMCIANALVILLQFQDAEWNHFTYLIPASLRQGIMYPGILFTFLAAFDHTGHAVSASTVYLVRSMGTNTLRSGLEEALSRIPDKWKIIEEIRHSVSAIHNHPPDIQLAARLVYFQGIHLSFLASACFGLVANIAALFTKGKGLHRSHGA
ncbi:MFS general substrate transporter [Aspergillus homomorphus CBS 101889]|uniref:MFS general substrate transporter n=1 Tax=Aspergillus homomorphus (strain CBS 101889) TaxID=1450537 RepID=A0A395I1F3_ASPHC|nr:MFS general substrate transporter [Aspergillus homomorphus CBS 101889]RAL13519.1 MFS general substrate transporter [Aspergillus homomorphus CBS 101889]